MSGQILETFGKEPSRPALGKIAIISYGKFDGLGTLGSWEDVKYTYVFGWAIKLTSSRIGKSSPDLQHLLRSLKHSDYRAAIEPARCRACGFEFSKEKLTKHSKCPECHSTWVLEPKIDIQPRSSSERT